MAAKTCVVVGYGPGVGHGVAAAFAGAGYDLALIARTPAKAEGLVGDLRQTGRRVELIAGDAGDEASLTAALRQAEAAGPVEALVYNAVRFRPGPPTSLTAAALAEDFATNVAGALVAANAVLPGMKARGRGAVLFTGGGWALYPSAAVASPAIGKAALRHLALMLAEELAGTGVRAGTVTILGQVQPGTPFAPDRIGEAFLTLATDPAAPAEVQFTGR